jgi:spore coat protein U-like protein
MRRASLFIAFAAAFPALCWSGVATAAVASCTVSTTSVAFGAYDPQSSTALDGVGSVKTVCNSSTTSASIAISAGNSGVFTTRTMKSGIYNLNYNLYTATTRTVIWGNGTTGNSTKSVGAGTVTSTVYGRITAQQNVGAGTYTDSLTVTVTF